MPQRIYTDNDSGDRVVVEWLRGRGHEVVTSAEAGNTRAPDEDQLQFAADGDRVLYTANVADFGRLHAEWMADGRQHAGIIARSYQQLDVGEQIRRLERILDEHQDAQMTNLFVYL